MGYIKKNGSLTSQTAKLFRQTVFVSNDCIPCIVWLKTTLYISQQTMEKAATFTASCEDNTY